MYTRFQTKTEQKPYPLGRGTYQYRLHKVVPTPGKKPATLVDTTNGFPAKRRLRNNCKTSNRWRVTTQIWVAKIHCRTTSQKHYLHLRSHVIAVELPRLCRAPTVAQTSFREETRNQPWWRLAGSRPSDKEGRVGAAHPDPETWDKGEVRSRKKFFRPFGPQFGLKMAMETGLRYATAGYRIEIVFQL